jgi:2'-5' RNA ligase
MGIMRYLCSFILTSNVASTTELHLDRKIKDASPVPFKSISGTGEFDTWLQMTLPYRPMVDLLNQVRRVEHISLRNRGEAHITVVTPVEFWKVLRPHGITGNAIDGIAREMNIQASRFEVLCLGKGVAKIHGKLEKAYYVVVQSDDLIRIRKKIQELLVSRGGNPEDFEPLNYFPHITLGFTKRDLHESDGVKKDIKSCIHAIAPY